MPGCVWQVSERLSAASSPAVRAKLQALLQAAIQGIAANPTVTAADLFVFAHGAMDAGLAAEEAARAAAAAAAEAAGQHGAGGALHPLPALPTLTQGAVDMPPLLHLNISRGKHAHREPDAAHLPCPSFRDCIRMSPWEVKVRKRKYSCPLAAFGVAGRPPVLAGAAAEAREDGAGRHQHLMVDAALRLLLRALRKGNAAADRSPANLSMLDGLLPVLSRALRSRHAAVAEKALRCLALVAPLPLPGK